MHGNMPRQPTRLTGAPVVKWLLISNIAIFFINMFTTPDGVDFGPLAFYGHFSVAQGLEHGQVWRFFTFQFLHGNAGHLFFNMFALYMFGSFVEQWWGSRKFIVFYLACGASGALFYAVLFQVGLFEKIPFILNGRIYLADYTPLVGASAGIYACLVAVAVIAPNLQIRLLFPPIPMKMKTFALGVLGIAVVVIFMHWAESGSGVRHDIWSNAGGEAGHLGGAILGFVLMKNPRWLAFVGEGFKGREKGSGGGHRSVDARVVREKKIRPRTHINLSDSEVDKILDKVNREGIQSLTEKERETLRRSAGH